MITNEIALLTPPLGVNLFIAMNLSNLRWSGSPREPVRIFLLILVVFFLIFFPDVVTFLPKALGMADGAPPWTLMRALPLDPGRGAASDLAREQL
ncbi:MAG: hypothetical protein ACLR0N_17830 [Bilophila wadsworthia]